MPAYVLHLINHLGEPFGARELDFDDDQTALDYAQALVGQAYPLEVRLDGRLVCLVPLPEWQVEEWLKPHLGPWPLG